MSIPSNKKVTMCFGGGFCSFPSYERELKKIRVTKKSGLLETKGVNLPHIY